MTSIYVSVEIILVLMMISVVGASLLQDIMKILSEFEMTKQGQLKKKHQKLAKKRTRKYIS